MSFSAICSPLIILNIPIVSQNLWDGKDLAIPVPWDCHPGSLGWQSLCNPWDEIFATSNEEIYVTLMEQNVGMHSYPENL